MSHALIVDDDVDSLTALAVLVNREGFTTDTASTLREAREKMAQRRPEVVLLDLVLPDGNGMDLFQDIESRSVTEVVLITGHASLETSVEALRLGAADYLIKPVNVKQLQSILSRVARPADLKAEINKLRGDLRSLGHFGRLIGVSTAMQKVYDQIACVAPTPATVLITGESGTGKELVSQTTHDLSQRKKELFIPINCSAISPQLIESEIFGHEKGSFTGATRLHKGYFERAYGGTLFLDEITEMPTELQVKLLRVLETNTFMRVGTNTPIATDVRVIAATNRNPAKAVTDGKLREDLYHRLNVFPIELPPLRERGTDIEILARHFLDKFNAEENTKKTFSPAAIAALYSHSWPGNVRELKNYVQRVYILADGVVDVDLAPRMFSEPAHTPLITVRVGSTLEEVNRRLIEATLAECGNVRRKAAEMLGISLKTLYNRLAQYKAEKDGTPLPAGKDEEEYESELK